MNLSIYSSSRKCSFLILLPVSQWYNFYSVLESQKWFHYLFVKQPIPSLLSLPGPSSAQLTQSWLTLRLQGLQHARLPCPSPTPGACSNSCPSSWWRHPTISSSVVPFSSCLWSFPASGSFLMRCLFTSGSQSIGASVSASVLPMNIQDWFPLGLTGWISSQSKGLSRIFSNTTVQKHRFFGTWLSLINSHPYMTTGKTIALTIWIFVSKVMSLLFNTLSLS